MDDNDIYEYEEGKGKKIVKIILLVILTIAVFVFGFWGGTKFGNVVENSQNKTDDKIENKTTEVEESAEVPKKEEMVARTEFIKEVVADSMENKYNDFNDDKWKAYALAKISTYTTKIDGQYYDSKINEVSRVGTTPLAKKCSDYNNLTDEEQVMCYFGMSEEEFNKVDKTLFENMAGGSLSFSVYDLDEIKGNLLKAYGTYGSMFNKTFNVTHVGCGTTRFIYDSNINKLYSKSDGGCTVGGRDRKVVDAKQEDNKYTVTYIEYIADQYKACSTGDCIDDSIYIFDENGKELYKIESFDDLKLDENIDKFTKHTATFEEVNGIYKFVK